MARVDSKTAALYALCIQGEKMAIQLHHVSVVCRDAETSARFYQSIFDFERLPRPNFSTKGVWLACGPSLQVHLVQYEGGNFRSRGVDNDDVHFAFRTDAFEKIVDRLHALGFSEDAPVDDPKRMILKRTGAAGFPQLYVMDPDRNIVEVNGAA